MYYHKYIYISELYQEKKISLVIPILFSLHAFGWSMVQQLRYLGDSQNSNGGIHHIVLGDRCVDIRKQRHIQLKCLMKKKVAGLQNSIKLILCWS